MRANRVISRGELVDAVWGQDPPASAEGGIYTYVAGLRRVFEPNRSLRGPGRVLVSSGAGYVLHLVPGQPDAVAFEQDLGRSRQLRKAGDLSGAVVALNSALSLWRGIAFAGVPGPFAEMERVRLGELRSAAAEERADVLLSLGRHEEVVPDLTAMVADNPLRERMRGLLMIALYRCGRHAEALRVFAEGRRVLADELGIDPGSDLSRIHQQVLTADPALAAPAGPALVTLDADATGTTSVLGDGRPRPRAEGMVTPVPAQLPLDAPGFSGRHEELSILQAMLPPKSAGSVGAEPERPAPSRRCRSWSSRVPRARGRPRSPSASAARSPSASPTASCTSTCAGWIRPPRRWSRPRRCGSSSTRWACRRTGSRPTSRAARPCSAACSTASGC
jgi:DNA-binding SARP family transcriptional activator